MARRAPRTSLKQISEINLTPLMDLTFILLITFIITFPLIEQGIPVDLPQAKAKDLTPDRARTISLDRNGRIYLDNAAVTPDELRERMVELQSAAADTTVMVRADESIRYSRVVDVLKILHDARIVKMALVTQADGESG